MSKHSSRVLELMDEITSLCEGKFRDLSPPDIVFALNHLLYIHNQAFDRQMSNKEYKVSETKQ